MKVYVLKKEQLVARPLNDVFAFYEKPENLERITPPWLGFRILTPSPVIMKLGARFDYTVRVMGVRLRWTSEISEYEPPHRFVDEQVRGPYANWHHLHTFAEVDGGTVVGDEVRYSMPFGMLGTFAQRIVVSRQLQDIFAYRERVIDELFGRPGSALSK